MYGFTELSLFRCSACGVWVTEATGKPPCHTGTCEVSVKGFFMHEERQMADFFVQKAESKFCEVGSNIIMKYCLHIDLFNHDFYNL